MNAMQGFIGESIPVLDRESGQLLGLVSESAIVTAYLKTVHQSRQEENDAL